MEDVRIQIRDILWIFCTFISVRGLTIRLAKGWHMYDPFLNTEFDLSEANIAWGNILSKDVEILSK